MKTIAHQSLFDIAVQQNGSVLCVVDWALANDISITDDIPAGANLLSPEATENEKLDVVSLFAGRCIATIAESPARSFGFDFGQSFDSLGRTDNYLAISNQSLFDIAVESHGSILSVIDWAIKNNISITDNVRAGQILQVPSPKNKNNNIALFFKRSGYKVATDIERQPSYLDYLFPNIFPLSL